MTSAAPASGIDITALTKTSRMGADSSVQAVGPHTERSLLARWDRSDVQITTVCAFWGIGQPTSGTALINGGITERCAKTSPNSASPFGFGVADRGEVSFHIKMPVAGGGIPPHQA